MIIRVRSPIGTKRVELLETDNYDKLLTLVSECFNVDKNGDWFLSASHNEADRLKSESASSISKLGLKHGDLIYFLEHAKNKDIGMEESGRLGDVNMDGFIRTPTGVDGMLEDQIDQELAKMDGRIIRKRNDQLCHHPSSGQCIHCVSLEPFDSTYLEHLDPPVKFMSFHAYLRKLSGGKSKGKYTSLENVSCRIRPGCRDHAPWPDGICTKCQPCPITLEIQSYRHVDFVQFENAQLMDTFLDYWRQSSCQRIGILLGRYAHFDAPGAPPLAIKAVVVAIYEPMQESTSRSVKLTAPLDALLPKHVIEVAQRLGLRPIGWIFTDLVAQTDSSKGVVKHYRGTADSFFLSAEECITAAHLQNLYPNVCHLSPSGYFGSKFVTIVATGDSSNHIHFEAYQVTNQAMALERDNILLPTYDVPELGYIRETTKEQFVPEVFYATKDKYDNRVTCVARPLPVEFLLTHMPAAFPIEPVYTMAKLPVDVSKDYYFPIENRECLGQIQDVPKFANALHQFGTNQIYTLLANFHVLAWLAGDDTLSMKILDQNNNVNLDPNGIIGLLDAVSLSSKSVTAAETAVRKWVNESTLWSNIQGLAKAVVSDLPPSPPLPKTQSNATYQSVLLSGLRKNTSVEASTTSMFSPGVSNPNSALPNTAVESSDSKHWACPHCTFHNSPELEECEMCRLPRRG